MPIDYLWMKLGDDRGIPFANPLYSSVNIHLTESIFTPKIGYRLYDGEHFKVDALAGIRYWYLSDNLDTRALGPQLWEVGELGRRYRRREIYSAPQ